ncbi:MAG: 3-oxoacyl-[acyl-carrier-protein] reductase [Spirochaetes bacterium]|nr:3-oxoacyl-[acyl-carrier-protein] reductase [Spirochaetota bacterium]
MDFKDKVALVTGGSRGIGRAIAERLAKDGAAIVLADVADSVKTTASEIAKQYNVKAVGVTGSVANEQDVKNLFKIISDEFGQLDICVNNAGISINSLTMRTSADDFDKVINVNLRSVFLVGKEAQLIMMKKKYGRIINISSIVGIRGNAGQPGYSASKAGVIGLTKTMAAEVAKRNITVNAVAPGFIETSMTKELDDKVKERYMEMIPLGKYGEVADVAEAVAFFASDRAKYITGQVLVVDGGMMLT